MLAGEYLQTGYLDDERNYNKLIKKNNFSKGGKQHIKNISKSVCLAFTFLNISLNYQGIFILKMFADHTMKD